MPTALIPLLLLIRHPWSALTSLIPARVLSLDDAERLRLALTRRIATHELN